MSRPTPRLVATSMLLSCLLLASGVIWLWFLNLGTEVQLDFGNAAGRLVLTLSGLVFVLVGWLISSRRPRHRVGWVTLGIGCSTIISNFSIEYAAYATLTAPGSLPGGELSAWAGNFIWVVPVGLLGTVLVLLYPDGHLAGRRWRYVLIAAIVGMGSATTFFALSPGPLQGLAWVENPLALDHSHGWIEYLAFGFFLLAATVPLAAWSLRTRYSNSQGTAREQIKWMAAAAALVALTYFGQFVFSVATDTLGGGSETQRWFQTLTMAAFGAMGWSIGVAILKHRLYDIDRIISRTLAHALVIALLGLVFFSVIAMFTWFLPSDDPLVVATATLAAAALFNPLRVRVRVAVDRRFNRSRFDAQRIFEDFSGSLRDRHDSDTVVDGWLDVVSSTMQPASLGMWVRDP